MDTSVDGEMLCIQSTTDGCAIVNRSRNQQDPVSDYDPVDLSLSWDLLNSLGLLTMWKQLGEKFERGTI